MTKLHMRVLDAQPQRHAASPMVRFHLQVSAPGAALDGLLLRVRFQIEPSVRVPELSMRPLQWTEVTAMVGSFTQQTTFDVLAPCTYDQEIASAKYFGALEGGDVPLRLFFNGTMFFSGDHGFNVEMVPWDLECTWRMPLAVWTAAIDTCFPNQAWIRVERDAFAMLRDYRVRRGLPSWEAVFSELLSEHVENPA